MGSCRTAQGAELVALWWPRGVGWGWGERLKREGMHIYLELIHIAQQRLTKHCKAVILQLKTKFKKFSFCIFFLFCIREMIVKIQFCVGSCSLSLFFFFFAYHDFRCICAFVTWFQTLVIRITTTPVIVFSVLHQAWCQGLYPQSLRGSSQLARQHVLHRQVEKLRLRELREHVNSHLLMETRLAPLISEFIFQRFHLVTFHHF